MCGFVFNDTRTTGIYTLSLHDALPSSRSDGSLASCIREGCSCRHGPHQDAHTLTIVTRPLRSSLDSPGTGRRSEEHTSELQSRQYLVCRLLLEKNNM